MKNKLTKALALLLALASVFTLAAAAAPAEECGLTEAQIEELQALPLTAPDSAIPYELAKTFFTEAELDFYYGNRDFASFADANAHLLSLNHAGEACFPALGMTQDVADSTEYWRLAAMEAAAELRYESPRLTVEFLTDEACVYQPDDMNCLTGTVRGIAKVQILGRPAELTAQEISMLCSFGLTKIQKGETLELPLDVHMNTVSGWLTNRNSIVPLG